MYTRRNWIGTSEAVVYFDKTYSNRQEIKPEDFVYYGISCVDFFLKTTRYTPPIEDSNESRE